MRRSLLTSAGLLFACVLAHAQHIYFTTFIPANCPIVIEGLTQSKDFGFQAVVFQNDSSQAVQSIHLKVTLSSALTPGQIADGGHVYIDIEPGEQKREDVFLGRMQALTQRAKSDHLDIARAMISVESVEFADGSRWEANDLVVFDPTRELRPLLPR
jgi:hypothetical protein